MGNKVEDRIKSIMSTVFEIPEEQIKDNSSPDTIESWDSLKHMNLIIALEEEFEVEFNDNEIFEMMNYTLIKSIITGK
jgi:acyl carrier protein